jgi:hypothetical protein
MLDRLYACAAAIELTVDGLALGQVAVVLAGEQRIAVAAHHALDVAILESVELLSSCAHRAYPYLTL